MKVFCTYCGAANAPDAQICRNCASAMAGPGTPDIDAPSGPLAPATFEAPAQRLPGDVPPLPAPWDPAPGYGALQVPHDPPPLYEAPGVPPAYTAWPPPPAPAPQAWPSYPPPQLPGAWPPSAASYAPQQPYPPPARDAYGRPIAPHGQPPAYGQAPYSQAPVPYGAAPSAFPVAPGIYGQAPAQRRFPPEGVGYSWSAYTSGAYPYAPAPAPPGSLSTALPRFGAYLFDAVMFMVLAMVVLTVTAAVGLGGISLLVLLGLHATYHIGFWATSGRTPGYKAAGLQMIKSDGSKPGLGTASIRYIGWLISPFVLYLNCLWMLWDARKQTWHDKMANTVVIKA